ncbi:hypothetical protein A3Q56_02087 [Intoshia linei]|uniref:RGS domain-containing protein n=1 Tax=Intoshia linei TaxID=1819745 RepID=A0A177B937_9BILA|nr:hypothetical protein A3Q56_02087 [Intoshia linei]
MSAYCAKIPSNSSVHQTSSKSWVSQYDSSNSGQIYLNLEEILSCDDLYVDFLNHYLSLPIFGVNVNYYAHNDGFISAVQSGNSTERHVHYYAAPDELKEKSLKWLHRHRINYFERSHLFAKYQLIKCLSRCIQWDKKDHALSKIKRYDKRNLNMTVSANSISTPTNFTMSDSEYDYDQSSYIATSGNNERFYSAQTTGHIINKRTVRLSLHAFSEEHLPGVYQKHNRSKLTTSSTFSKISTLSKETYSKSFESQSNEIKYHNFYKEMENNICSVISYYNSFAYLCLSFMYIVYLVSPKVPYGSVRYFKSKHHNLNKLDLVQNLTSSNVDLGSKDFDEIIQILINIQHSALKRLRVYWISRYLTHKFNINVIKSIPEHEQSTHKNPKVDRIDTKKALDQVVRKLIFNDDLHGGPFMDYLKEENCSFEYKLQQFCNYCSKLVRIEKYSNYNKKQNAQELINLSWCIYGDFFVKISPNYCEIDQDLIQNLRKRLINVSSENVNFDCGKTNLNLYENVFESIFEPIFAFCVDQLKLRYISYVRLDAGSYFECTKSDSLRTSETNSSTESEPNKNEPVNIEMKEKKPWSKSYPESTLSERANRLRTALSLSENMDQQRKIGVRRKALKHKLAVNKAKQKAITVSRKSKYDRTNSVGHSNEISQDSEKSAKENMKSMTQFKIIITRFKKYINTETNSRTINMANLLFDIDAYKSINNVKNKNSLKDIQAKYIYKTYFDEKGRHRVDLTGIPNKSINSRPKTAQLNLIRENLTNSLYKDFNNYWETEIDEHGSHMVALTVLTRDENKESGPIRNTIKFTEKLNNSTSEYSSTSDTSEFTIYPLKIQMQTDIRIVPTKEDRFRFNQMMDVNNFYTKWKKTERRQFYNFLRKHQKDTELPNSSRAFRFYYEAILFKNTMHPYNNECTIKSKVHAMMETFLESVLPNFVAIELPPDVMIRTLKSMQKFGNRESDSLMLDESMYTIYKNILPFFATFRQRKKVLYNIPEKDEEFAKRRLLYEEMKGYAPNSARTESLRSLPVNATNVMNFSIVNGITWKA